MKLQASERLVAVLVSKASIRGLPWPSKVNRLHGITTADDLVHRKFHRLSPSELLITDISPAGSLHRGCPRGASHETRQTLLLRGHGHLLLRRSLAARSTMRKDSALVVHALDMAVKNRSGRGCKSSFSTGKNGAPGWILRTPYSTTSRSSVTGSDVTLSGSTSFQSSTSYDPHRHPSPPDHHTKTGNQTVGQVNQTDRCPERCCGYSARGPRDLASPAAPRDARLPDR